MKDLPTLASLPRWTTKGDLIARVDPQVAYDIALPQDWVNHITNLGFDPLGQVVWAYPHGYVWGLPMPLTEEHRQCRCSSGGNSLRGVRLLGAGRLPRGFLSSAGQPGGRPHNLRLHEPPDLADGIRLSGPSRVLY